MLLENESPIRLVIDTNQYIRTLALLKVLGKAGPIVIADELNAIAELWRREIVRHMPVDQGLARNSVQVFKADPSQNPISAAVGTNVPYVVYLEFGWEHGAGLFGKVYQWKFGDAPETRWFAKDFDLYLLEHHGINRYWSKAQGRYVERRMDPEKEQARKRLAGAYSPGKEEFAPPFRGAWQLIQDRIVARFRKRVASLMQRGVV